MKNWLDFTAILLAHAEGPGSPCGLLGAYWKEIKGKKFNIFVLIFLTMFYCWHFYFWKYFYLIVCILFWKKNIPILSGRSIWSFRHLELKNPFIILDFRHITRIVQQFWKRSSSSRRRRRRRRSTVLLQHLIYIYIY